MFWSIDIWLLVRFERLADFTHEWFGYGAPSWERACIVSSIPLALAQDRSTWIIALDIAWSCFLFLQVDDTAPTSEAAASNPKKLVLHPVRAFALGFLAFDLSTWLILDIRGVLWFWAIAPSMYFASCDRKPPRTSRVKQALRKLANAKAPQPVAVGSR